MPINPMTTHKVTHATDGDNTATISRSYADSSQPLVSVLVKCYNEESKLARCLRSLLDAAGELRNRAGQECEIVVVDSLSTDGSVAVAQGFPVRLVQLVEPVDRRCGAVAQLGYQFARGTFLLVIDGDMELCPGFLPAALAALAAEPRLAGVGGQLIECSDGMEFRERQLRGETRIAAGAVSLITGCALYRAAAIRDLGYLTDRNLHCYEEFELGLRLVTRGWHLRMLDLDCVRHHGHRAGAVRLLVNRWNSRFMHGHGELLRTLWRRPRRAVWPIVHRCRMGMLASAWWLGLAGLAVLAGLVGGTATLAVLVVWAIAPVLGFGLRKRNLRRAGYAFLVWQVAGAAMLAGLCLRRVPPTRPIVARLIGEPDPMVQPAAVSPPSATGASCAPLWANSQ